MTSPSCSSTRPSRFKAAFESVTGWMEGRIPRLLLAAVVAWTGAFAIGPGPTPLAAQETGPDPQNQQECCLLLLVPMGARASALGGSITALGGADAVFRNPAGLAAVRGGRFLIHHSDVTVDEQIDAFSLLFTPFSSTFGVSYQLFDKGEIETTDETGQVTGELSLRDHLLVGSFAVELLAGVSVGMSYKFFQQRIDCTGLCGGEQNVATTQAADFGLRWSPRWHQPLEVGDFQCGGCAGFALQVINDAQSDPFPGRIHVGVAYDVLGAAAIDSLVSLRVAVDARDRLADPGSPTLAYGVELDLDEAVFLRAGYAPGEGLGTGAAVGLELRYDRFNIGVSRSFVNSTLEADGEPFQVSLGLNF